MTAKSASKQITALKHVRSAMQIASRVSGKRRTNASQNDTVLRESIPLRVLSSCNKINSGPASPSLPIYILDIRPISADLKQCRCYPQPISPDCDVRYSNWPPYQAQGSILVFKALTFHRDVRKVYLTSKANSHISASNSVNSIWNNLARILSAETLPVRESFLVCKLLRDHEVNDHKTRCKIALSENP